MIELGTPVAILAKKAEDVASFKSYQFGSGQP